MKMIQALKLTLICMLLAACKKDRTCECTITTATAGGTTVTSTKTITYRKITKSKMKDACTRISYSDSTSSYTSGCELK